MASDFRTFEKSLALRMISPVEHSSSSRKSPSRLERVTCQLKNTRRIMAESFFNCLGGDEWRKVARLCFVDFKQDVYITSVSSIAYCKKNSFLRSKWQWCSGKDASERDPLLIQLQNNHRCTCRRMLRLNYMISKPGKLLILNDYEK